MTFAPEIMQQLKGDEGLRLKPYKDSVGVLTIGYGTNLEAGITEREADFMLYNRMTTAQNDVYKYLPWCRSLDSARFGVLVNMAFNIGIGDAMTGTGLLGFKEFLAAMEAKQWEQAAHHLEGSLWWHQVGPRAKRLQKQVLTGEWQYASATAAS